MRPVSDFTPVWAYDTRTLAGENGPFKSRPSPHDRRRPHLQSSELDETESDGSDAGQVHSYSRPVTADPDQRRDPYYVAGHDPAQSLPASPFPHADTVPRPGYTRSTTEKHARNAPPDNASPSCRSSLSLQQRHLAVVTQIMHTCLLRGDWDRAGRAWGLLVSTLHAGKYIDIRANGRWGIGAEILLRRGGAASTGTGTGTTGTQSNADRTRDESPPIYSRDAFRAARDYYEQLILQFPYNKYTAAGVASALDFYPALIGICILEATSLSAAAVADLDLDDDDAADGYRSDMRHHHDDDYSSDADGGTSHTSRVTLIKREELEAARQLATRLDSVLAAPPYDKHVQLLQLRAMVALWTADLLEYLIRLDKMRIEESSVKRETSPTVEHSRGAVIERSTARRLLYKSIDAGGSLPEVLQTFVDA